MSANFCIFAVFVVATNPIFISFASLLSVTIGTIVALKVAEPAEGVTAGLVLYPEPKFVIPVMPVTVPESVPELGTVATGVIGAVGSGVSPPAFAKLIEGIVCVV